MTIPLANPSQPYPLQIGRQVRYVMGNGEIRTATVSHIWDHVNGIINCHVFTDPTMDPPVDATDRIVSTTPIARKVKYDGQNDFPYTWHWPNKTPPEIMPVGGNAPQQQNGNARPLEQNKSAPQKPVIKQQPVSPDGVDGRLMTSGYIDSIPPDVDCILSLQDESQDRFVRGAMPTIFAWMPIPDKAFPGIGWLETAVQTVALWRSMGWKVLVHCSDGQSRAGLVDVAYHMRLRGWNRDESLSMVRTKRTGTNPNPYFLQGLVEYYQHLHSGSVAPQFETMEHRQIGPAAPAVPAGMYPRVGR
jgi:hypothetical protein